MWKENLYCPFEILIREHEHFPLGEHQHSFFEMACITSGTGLFYVADRVLDYAENPFLLIAPNTAHRFVVTSRSRFVFLRFTDHYLAQSFGKLVEEAFYTYSVPHTPSLNRETQENIRLLLDLICKENLSGGMYSSYLQTQWLNSIMILIARNLIPILPDSHSELPSDKIMLLLEYIQRHISTPHLLRIQVLSREFGLSENYISRYFRQHLQESLQQYVTRYRLKETVNLLNNTSLSVKEIAYRMGYVDSSHLIRVFRQFYHLSPSQYRKQE